jgi:hypothetical protein
MSYKFLREPQACKFAGAGGMGLPDPLSAVAALPLLTKKDNPQISRIFTDSERLICVNRRNLRIFLVVIIPIL